MTKRIRWSPQADNDLDQILEYLNKKWSNSVAVSFLDRIDEMTQLILNDPALFPVIEDGLKIRRCVLTKHNSLYYIVVEDGINILRVFDTRQDPNKLRFTD